jgi:hypothetical protein
MRIALLQKSLCAAGLFALLALPSQSQQRAPTSQAAHAALWRQVSPTASAPQLAPIVLDPEQIAAIQALLLNRTESDGWGCEDDIPPDDWLKDLAYWKITLTPTVETILIQTGNTCGRSGQNSPNGAMWILTFNPTGEPILLATPQESFNGALYSIQSTHSSGLPDLVITWKLAAPSQESTLTYFRFDGKLYQPITAATLSTSATGKPTITPIHIPDE